MKRIQPRFFSSPQYTIMILPLLAFVQVFHKPIAHSVKFANGSVLTYKYLQPETLVKKSRTFQLDVTGFLANRLASLVPGNPDKSVNNLAYENKRGGVEPYLYQAVPVSRDTAIGVIAHSWISSSVPHDGLHDLVLICVKDRPKIDLIRTIELTYDESSSQTLPRLFWSKNQLLLRNSGGFDVIDSLGNTTGEYPHEKGSMFVGLNQRGELVFVNAFKHFSLEIFNLATRKWSQFNIEPPSGHFNLATCILLPNKSVQIDLNANYFEIIGGQKEMKSHSIRYLIDSINGKIIGKPVVSGPGGT